MSVAEAMTRMTEAVATFLSLEDDKDSSFSFAIEHKRPKDTYTKFEYRVVIQGFKSKENIALFETVNKADFSGDLETAVESAFLGVREVLRKFNQKRAEVVKDAAEALQRDREQLSRLERNFSQMGGFDPKQVALPFDLPAAS